MLEPAGRPTLLLAADERRSLRYGILRIALGLLGTLASCGGADTSEETGSPSPGTSSSSRVERAVERPYRLRAEYDARRVTLLRAERSALDLTRRCLEGWYDQRALTDQDERELSMELASWSNRLAADAVHAGIASVQLFGSGKGGRSSRVYPGRSLVPMSAERIGTSLLKSRARVFAERDALALAWEHVRAWRETTMAVSRGEDAESWVKRMRSELDAWESALASEERVTVSGDEKLAACKGLLASRLQAEREWRDVIERCAKGWLQGLPRSSEAERAVGEVLHRWGEALEAQYELAGIEEPEDRWYWRSRWVRSESRRDAAKSMRPMFTERNVLTLTKSQGRLIAERDVHVLAWYFANGWSGYGELERDEERLRVHLADLEAWNRALCADEKTLDLLSPAVPAAGR